MKKRRVYKLKTVLLIGFTGLVLCYVLLFAIDRNYGHKLKSQISNDSISMSCGDIIFKETSFILAQSKSPEYGCLPGHLGIILSDTTISLHSMNFENLIVAESSFFNLKERKIVPDLKINSAENNFGYATGRLFLIKTCLNDIQKKEILQYAESNIEKPYHLLSQKNDTKDFNCATFVWHAFKKTSGMDIDLNGGNFVLPSDILSYFIKEKYEIIRF